MNPDFKRAMQAGYIDPVYNITWTGINMLRVMKFFIRVYGTVYIVSSPNSEAASLWRQLIPLLTEQKESVEAAK